MSDQTQSLESSSVKASQSNSNNFISISNNDDNLSTYEKFSDVFVTDKINKLSHELKNKIRKQNGILNISSSHFSNFLTSTMEIVERDYKDLSNVEKRALVIQTLYLMYPNEENEDLIFNILPNLIDSIISLCKNKNFKRKIKRFCY